MNAPQRLKTMTHDQLIERVLKLEAVIESVPDKIAAEREACNKAAQKAINKINVGTAQARDWTMAELKLMIAQDVEAAIRARGEGARHEA